MNSQQSTHCTEPPTSHSAVIPDSAEFDDVAVHMSITLLYEAAPRGQKGSYIYIPSPDALEAHVSKFGTYRL